MTAPTLGVLLAGGLARRMGGGDKPLQGDRRTHNPGARDRAASRRNATALILNANGDPARFAFTGLPVVPDDVPGFAGPLAGILAALDWAAPQPARRSNGSRARPPTRPSCRTISSRVCTPRAPPPACRSPAPNRAARRIR